MGQQRAGCGPRVIENPGLVCGGDLGGGFVPVDPELQRSGLLLVRQKVLLLCAVLQQPALSQSLFLQRRAQLSSCIEKLESKCIGVQTDGLTG